jgi:hypothetical protein
MSVVVTAGLDVNSESFEEPSFVDAKRSEESRKIDRFMHGRLPLTVPPKQKTPTTTPTNIDN